MLIPFAKILEKYCSEAFSESDKGDHKGLLTYCEVALPTNEGDLEIGWRHPGNGAVTPVVRLPDGWRVHNLSNTHE